MVTKQNVITSTLVVCTLMLLGCGASSVKDNSMVVLPSQVIDLSLWKLNVPTDLDENGKIDEITVEALKSYSHPDFFYVDDDGYVVFAAPNKAITTANSSNTRSEMHQVLSGTSLGEAVDEAYPPNNFVLASHKSPEAFAQIGGNLQATLKVNHVAKRAGYPEKFPAYSVVVGQIHAGKDAALKAEGKGFGWGNEPLKIYYKKWPDHEYGSVFWNYEVNLPKSDPKRTDISYPVWGNVWSDGSDPGERGIALGEEFSYEVNVAGNIMALTFTTQRHGTVSYEIDLSNNIDAYGKANMDDHPQGYAGDWHFFKAGAYNQCSTRDAPGFWYVNCPGSGNWEEDKKNGDYVSVSFKQITTGPAK